MTHPLVRRCSVVAALTMLVWSPTAWAQSNGAATGVTTPPAVAKAVAQARPEYQDVTIPAGTKLALTLTSSVASDTRAVEEEITAELTRATTGAVSAADARGQEEPAPGLPGIASFEHAASRSSVLLVAVLSLVSLGIGLGVMFTRRPATVQLPPADPESGLHRAQRAAAAASAGSTRI